MTTTFAHLPLDDIRAHPNNPRRDAAADEEMIASVKSIGLVQSLVVAPAADGDGYVLIAGHRRLDACRKAKLVKAPCTIRTDVPTDAQQLELMLVENGRRKDLTAIEESEGYAQLELFGYKPKDIAKATGRTVATVKARLQLRDLSDKTRTKVHDGQVTIGDALAMVEFADDADSLGKLEHHAGTSNFKYTLEQVRRDAKSKAALAGQVKYYTDLGAVEVKGEVSQTWDADEGPCPISWTSAHEEAGHDGCLGWMIRWNQLTVVCTEPGKHPKEKSTSADEPEVVKARQEREAGFERQRAESAALREAETAAANVRVGHAIGVLEATKLPDVLTDMVRALLPSYLIGKDRDGRISDHLATALGYDAPPRYNGDSLTKWIADSTTWTRPQIVRALAAILMIPAEELLGDPEELEDGGDETQAAHGYLTWLAATDHSFCDVDVEIRDTIATALTEDDEEAAS